MNEIEYGSEEHLSGLSREALESEFRWLLDWCRELEAECIRLGRWQRCRIANGTCSRCGALVHESASMYWRYLDGGFRTVEHRPINFCPNCGRKVIS